MTNQHSFQLLNKCRTAVVFSALFITFINLGGCDNESSGFALPPGNKEAGAEIFVSLACNYCHSVQKSVQKAEAGHPNIHFKLGGTTTRVRTYGDLVTSIINPSHKISGYQKSAENVNAKGESNMRNYNDFMTVQQLIDLTEFLRESYHVVPPSYPIVSYGP